MGAKKVLIVDDSRTVRRHVASVLTAGGFDVTEAVDGVDGAEKIESTEDFSAVVCDVNMPRMSGIEMLERVKSDGKNAKLPIILLTTEGQPELIARAKRAGAKGWLVKPFRPNLLMAAVRKLVESQ